MGSVVEFVVVELRPEGVSFRSVAIENGGGNSSESSIEVGAVVVPVPVPVDMVEGWTGGAVGTWVGTIGGAVGVMGGTVGAGFTCPEAGGSIKEVLWRVPALGRVMVLWGGLGGSVLMAAVG